MKFDEYAKRFSKIQMERRNGILLMRLHTDGGPLRWDMDAQQQFGHAFDAVGSDRDNRVVILTGTGDEFSGPRVDPKVHTFFHGAKLTPSGADPIFRNGRKMLMALLNIEVPMIAAVNGPAQRHCDLALTCDIVIAADHASFEDTAHFHLAGIVPGDGISSIYTLLLGLNRARYLMLTGQVLSATEAKQLGLVAEVMSSGKLMPRAWELAEQLASKPDMLLRHTRSVLIHPLRKAIEDDLQYFMALECLGALDRAG